MGYFKQLHIDCVDGECVAGVDNYETCYMQKDNVGYNSDYDSTIDEVE